MYQKTWNKSSLRIQSMYLKFSWKNKVALWKILWNVRILKMFYGLNGLCHSCFNKLWESDCEFIALHFLITLRCCERLEKMITGSIQLKCVCERRVCRQVKFCKKGQILSQCFEKCFILIYCCFKIWQVLCYT